MRFLAGFILLAVVGLLAGCGESPEDRPLRLRHPSPTVGAAALLPTLPPLPTVDALPPVTPLPTAALLPAATAAPAVTPLPTATELPVPTPLPTAAFLPAVTPLPTVAPLPAATVAPAVTPLPTVSLAPAAVPDLELPVVTIGGFSWPVELAVTAEEQVLGLSGRAELAAGSGMLFVWGEESRRSFWMPDMNFPLDMVWIDGDCLVVAITREAPPQRPGQSRAELPRYVVDGVQYVLEINAGEAALRGVKVGDGVEFGGGIDGECGG